MAFARSWATPVAEGGSLAPAKVFMIFVPFLFLLGFLIAGGIFHRYKPLPAGLSFAGQARPVAGLRFLADLTFVDGAGSLRRRQEIFDEAFRIIAAARVFILLDFFLYNQFNGHPLGAVPGGARLLTDELTDLLVERQAINPAMEIIVITDPINNVYGGLPSTHLARLRQAGITVVVTNLDRLRDSNSLYSIFWRFFMRPFGSGPGKTIANPFGNGRISLRSYLRLLNFKANHRKVLIADCGDGYVGLVTSANPHDSSSSHTNVGISFSGPAVADLLESERAVLAFSGAGQPRTVIAGSACRTEVSLQVLTERRIKEATLTLVDGLAAGDGLDLVMFYLADRAIIASLKRAWRRGVRLRLILDPNKEAFGRSKNGIPNRQVARELVADGVEIRWYDSHGEQGHAKMLLARHRGGSSTVILGSANLTRRNLDDFNLETDVLVSGPHGTSFLTAAADFFDLLWGNAPDRRFTVDYRVFAEDSCLKAILYRFVETTGMCTF